MQKIPPLKTLPVFLSICKHLNFTRAAEELCLTHSAISHSLRQLEDFLDKTLIHRTTRKVSLTKAGVQYEKKIRQAMTVIENATSQVMQKENIIKINVMHSLAMKWVIPRLPAFKTAFPGVQIELETTSTTGDPLVDEAVDIAIVYAQKEALQDYVVKFFDDDHLVLVGVPQKKTVNIKQLLQQEVLLTVSDSLRKGDWELWCEGAGELLPDNRNATNFQSTVQAIQAAVSGLGILVTHYLFVEKALKQGRLVQLSDKKITTSRGYYIATTSKNIKRPAVKKCINWLLEQRHKHKYVV